MREEIPPALRVIGVPGMPDVAPGDDLAGLTVAAVDKAGVRVDAGDVVVFTQKIVSKAEDRLVRLDALTPSTLARDWADAWGKDPRVVELVLQESVRIVRMARGVIIAETRHGFVCANAGVDTSNLQPGLAARLPKDPDASARRLCLDLRAAWQTPVGVVISDTFGRPWREGQTNVAIGVSGMRAILDYRGCVDTGGQKLQATAIAVADEIAAAAELVMGKTRRVPVAIVQGTGLGDADPEHGSARDLLRRSDEDLFR